MIKVAGFMDAAQEFEDLVDVLEEYEEEADDILHKALRSTAFAVESDARRWVNVETGALRSDIMAHPEGEIDWAVGVTKEYGPSLEYGAAPHSITPNGPYPLRFFWERKGTWVSTYHVEHPGITPARPYLRPALNYNRSTLVKNIEEEIEKLERRG